MRDVHVDVLAALAQRQLIARDFIWIVAQEFGTGTDVEQGFWNDVGNVFASVIDPDTLSPVSRQYVGSGSLITIEDIPLIADLTVRTVNATLNSVSEDINDLVRGYNLKGARVEIHRGLFSPESRGLFHAAEIRFVGEIDQVSLNTPAVGEAGTITVTMVSATRELTRSNSAKRSDEDQQRRAAGDRFFQYAGTVADRQFFWGQASGKVPSITIGSGNPAADAARKAGLRG